MQNQIPYIVGVTGGSASGKTSLLKALGQLFSKEEVCILSQDNYYKPAAEQTKDPQGHINFDLPTCLDLDAFHDDLLLLKSSKEVKRREYRFQHEEQLGDWIHFPPAPIVIIEGLFIFYRLDIKDHFDLKIFVEAKEELQFERRLKRDTLERNIDASFVHYQWQNHVMPAYRQYLEPYKSEADILINNNEHFQNSLKVIEDHFRMLLNKTKTTV